MKSNPQDNPEILQGPLPVEKRKFILRRAAQTAYASTTYGEVLDFKRKAEQAAYASKPELVAAEQPLRPQPEAENTPKANEIQDEPVITTDQNEQDERLRRAREEAENAYAKAA